MKKQEISLDSDFKTLLQKLEPDAKKACLLTGGGWPDRLAWNPCGVFTLGSGMEVNEELHRFVGFHQARKHLIVGFLNYDLGYSLHGLKKTKKDRFDLPNAVFAAYDNYLEAAGGKTYAHFTDDNYIKYIAGLDKSALENTGPGTKPRFKPLWDRKSYADAYAKIKGYIYEGVIYQINLTQQLEASSPLSPRSLFADLSKTNTGKMKAYFESGDFEIISMSPERFVRSEERAVETFPIKGTRPRGKDKKEDKSNEIDLLNDEKEKAELNMITDLLRNDLGKVCSAGSVKVASKRQVERLTSVMHTFSHIRGRLKDGTSPLEALLSMFPGGSITGCPKRKAMEKIDELEQYGRGAYCGSMLVIDGSGNLDSNILIRTIVRQNDRLSLSVGSGIVHDSVEQKEYQENLDKARSLSDNPL